MRISQKTYRTSQKIQGTYFKISALYFKIYALYFLQSQSSDLLQLIKNSKNRIRF